MNVRWMNNEMSEFAAEADALARKKNRDYHPDDVAYLEILRTAHETGVRVEQDLWGRIRKQLSALRSYVIDGRVQSESPRSRMTDIANYMAILAVWDRYKSQIITDAITYVAGTPCELLLSNERNRQCYDIPYRTDACDRCAFLLWLCAYPRPDLASPAPSSPPTPKPLG